jgi:hypothetical protein
MSMNSKNFNENTLHQTEKKSGILEKTKQNVKSIVFMTSLVAGI